MYTVTFKIENSEDVKVPASLNDNILTLAQNAGVEIDAPCSGNGTCGKCRVRLISGTVEHPAGSRLSAEEFADGWRLACQSLVSGDAVFMVPSEAGAFKNGIRTADLSSPEEMAMYENAIGEIFAAGIAPGCGKSGCGIAVDIGTTTVTAAMLELDTGRIIAKASSGNGQIRYGADVINRIIQSSRPGGREKLMRAVREETLIPLMETLCSGSGRKPEDIRRIVIAGNTTMEHLFVGEDAESIRLEPFIPAFLELHGKTAADVGLPAAPDAEVIFAPNVGSYVGGDITAGALPSMLWKHDHLSLFVDLGTNGELVLGNSEYMLCCACSAGPAFEGGDISCGMRATRGAIQSISIDKETMEPALDIIGEGAKPAGLCGSGIIDLISELFRCEIISPKGRFIRSGERIKHDDYGGASYVLAFASESASGRDIELNESDIDNFIRAKAAIYSAIRTMVKGIGLTVDDLDSVIIAGGIGSGIDIEKSISIGMLPKLPLEKYSYIGNSSLTGACAMLLSSEAEEKVFDIGRSMTYIELSTDPSYMDEFIAACFLPHTDTSLFD